MRVSVDLCLVPLGIGVSLGPSIALCQEEIKAWKKCFEEQRALDGRASEGLPGDGALQKARQKLDPEKYDKQGRPLKR